MALSAKDILGLGLTRGQKVRRSFFGGLRAGVGFGATGAGLIAFQAARADKGGFIPAVVGQGIALGASIPFAGIAAMALALVPGIGPLEAATMGAVLADYPELLLGTSLARGVRLFTDTNKRVRHMEMGGNYQDTELAQRQRLIALQDMNAATIPARRYLGQEALLMHR